jgi:radical SAM superfamily enzyme YgiQ (UPF0313 family)
MRVLLIDPGYKKGRHFHPHVGLGYIAATLEGWNEVIILDLNFPDNKKLARLLSSGVDLVGVTATSFTFRRSAAILNEVKAINKRVKTVVGGPHTTIAGEEILQHAQVDYVVYGEGERTITELVRLLEKRPDPAYEELAAVKGLMFRHNGEVVVNPAREWISNLDEVLFPTFHLWEIERYPTYPLLTSRGCPYGCIYCATGVIWGRHWRARSPSNIIEEIRYAQRAYHWDHKPFGIVDDSFNISVPRVLEFCEQLIQNRIDIEWACQGLRANNVTPELAQKMKMAGCRSVGIGVESADPEVLRNIKKGETLEEISIGIENLSRAGMIVQGSFMIGNPGDNLESCRKSIEFVKGSPLHGINFYLALPYPKTELWQFVQKHGHFLRQDYTEFQNISDEPVFETPDFSVEERTEAYRLAQGFVRRRNLVNLPRQGLVYLRATGLRKIRISRLARLFARFVAGEFKNACGLLTGKGHPWEQ